MAKYFVTPNPANASLDPQKNVFFFDEDCPTKVKNFNQQVVWVGNDVYFEGGRGKLTKIIQVGVGPDDFYLAEVTTPKGKKVRLNAKALYLNKLDNMFQNKGIGLPILIGIGVVGIIFLIIYLANVLDQYEFVLTW